jgi:type IV pilus assembly protein PilV
MTSRALKHKLQKGVMLIEALLAILIFSIGILAIVGMQATAVKTVTDSKNRSEASLLADQLMSQIWTDNGNVALYAYPGAGAPPARMANWMNAVNARLPNATSLPPIVTITNPTPQGAIVEIQMRWLLPEEMSRGLPPHNHVATAAVYW